MVEDQIIHMQAMKAYRGNRDIDPPILNFRTKWRCLASAALPLGITQLPTEWDALRVPEPLWVLKDEKNLFALTGPLYCLHNTSFLTSVATVRLTVSNHRDSHTGTLSLDFHIHHCENPKPHIQ
jgi:hypothetical protein